MNKYSILKVISSREPALLQSVYEEVKKEDKDAGSLVEELDSLASEGLIEEHKGEAGVAYVLTESGKKKLDTIGE
jgi:hypothetical protein